MTMQPFQPADGVKARWRYCAELAETRDVDDHITVQEVMEVLECDEHVAWASMREARDHLEEDGKRSVRTVAGFGWIVASASVQLGMASDRQRRAGRQIKKARRVLAATPREELTPFERQAADRQAAALEAIQGLFGRRRRVPLSQIGKGELPAASSE